MAPHFFDEMALRIDPGQRRFFGLRPVPSSPENIRSVAERVHYQFFGMLAPVLATMETRYVQAATMTDHARLACALERFRIARGGFPATLAELSPEFIPALPAEIVNGEPYRYRRSGNVSFVLYTVGTDLRDDGVIDPKASAAKQTDWVWRLPAK